ncbi:MAG: hypothetical protein AAF468_03470 [Pseudomonadota bacterium]
MSFSNNNHDDEAIQKMLRDRRIGEEQAEEKSDKVTWMVTSGAAAVAVGCVLYLGTFYLPDDLMANVLGVGGETETAKLDDSKLRKATNTAFGTGQFGAFGGGGLAANFVKEKMEQKRQRENNMTPEERRQREIARDEYCKKHQAKALENHRRKLEATHKYADKVNAGNPFAAIGMISNARSGAMSAMVGFGCMHRDMNKRQARTRGGSVERR